MMLKRICILYLSFILIASCNENKSKDSDIEIIDVESNIANYNGQLHLSELALDVQYISLETNSKCLLKDISYVDISEKFILVNAKDGIYLFSHTGKFLREIGNKGNGPGEYHIAGISRIFNDSIFIPTIIPYGKIFVFDTKCRLLFTIPTSGHFFSVREDNWFYEASRVFVNVRNESGKEKNRLIQLNLLGDTIKTFPNTTFFNGGKNNMSTGSALVANQFYSYKNSIMYKENLNDTLWQISDDRLIPRYVFKRGRYGIPTEYRELSMDEYLIKTVGQIDISKILESNDYVFFKIWLFKNNPFKFRRTSIIDNLGEHSMPYPVLGCYNKKTKHTFIVKPTSPGEQPEPTGIYNDFDGGINFLPNNAINEKEFISWFEAFDLKNYITTPCFKNSTPKYPEKKRELEQLANSLNDNDNPVLMLVKLKE